MHRTQCPSGWVMVSNNRRADNNQKAHVTTAGHTRRAAHSYMHAHLLSGTSCLTLSIASTILALGICMPGDAQAQTTVNPVQTTTFTLDPAQNPITFGPATSIDTSATFNSDAVSGDTGTAWNVTNQGILQGN